MGISLESKRTLVFIAGLIALGVYIKEPALRDHYLIPLIAAMLGLPLTIGKDKKNEPCIEEDEGNQDTQVKKDKYI
jgi:hypothetical protein